MNIVHQRETSCFLCAKTVSLSKVWQAYLLLSLWLFSHGYRGNAWQFERDVIRVISSNGSLHKYRIQIKANWTSACVNKELNCLRVFGTGTTLFASAVLLFSALSLPPPSSSSSHSYCWCSDSMETRPSPLPKVFLTVPPMFTFVGGLWEDYPKNVSLRVCKQGAAGRLRRSLLSLHMHDEWPNTQHTAGLQSGLGLGRLDFNDAFMVNGPPIVFHSYLFAQSADD